MLQQKNKYIIQICFHYFVNRNSGFSIYVTPVKLQRLTE